MESPDITKIRRSLSFAWPEGPVVRVNQIYRDKLGVHANLQIGVSPNGHGPIHVQEGMLNLSAVPSRGQWNKRLLELQPEYTWYEVLETVCKITIAHISEGRPAVYLDQVPWGPLQPRLAPLLYKRQPTILFGDGGSAKTTLALRMAAAIASGGIFLGQQAEKSPVLYLDWEADDETMARRLDSIKRGFGCEDQIDVVYKRLYGLLTEQIDMVADLCAQYNVKVVMFDSMGKATANAPDGAAAALSFFDCAESLERDILIIDHVDKAHATPGKPYGSIFKWNSARAVWYAETMGEPREGEIYILLTQTKTNDLAKHKSIPLRVTFETGYTSLTEQSWQDLPQEARPETMKTWDAIAEALRGEKLTFKKLSEITGIKIETVRKSIERNKSQVGRAIAGGETVLWLLSVGR